MPETHQTMKLSIPVQPPKLNQLMRGRLRDRMRLEATWKYLVALAWNQSGLPKATCKRRVSILIVKGPRQYGADPDAYLKATGDALKACRAIKGDSQKWVEWAPVRYTTGPEPGCIIELEDIP